LAAPRNGHVLIVDRARPTGCRRIVIAAVVAWAPMTAAAPMQWKAIRLSVVAVGVRRAICRPLALLGRLLLRLTASDERRQTVHLFVIWLGCVLRARLEVLGLRLRLMLFARIERLRFARRKRLAAHVGLFVVAIVEGIVSGIAAHLALLLLMVGLALAKLFLCGGDQAEIMFGMLIIIFGGNRIPGTLSVAG